MKEPPAATGGLTGGLRCPEVFVASDYFKSDRKTESHCVRVLFWKFLE